MFHLVSALVTDCKRAAVSTTGRDRTPPPPTQFDREYKIEIPFRWGAMVGEQPAKADATLAASACVRHAALQMLPSVHHHHHHHPAFAMKAAPPLY